jgi:hypothetical protein
MDPSMPALPVASRASGGDASALIAASATSETAPKPRFWTRPLTGFANALLAKAACAGGGDFNRCLRRDSCCCSLSTGAVHRNPLRWWHFTWWAALPIIVTIILTAAIQTPWLALLALALLVFAWRQRNRWPLPEGIMRSTVMIVAVVGAAFVLQRLLDFDCATSERCERYCVSVEPEDGDTHTVYTFSGRGWRPSHPVEALYGKYCQPTEEIARPSKPVRECVDIGYFERFRTDKHGRFTFRFRNGPGPRRPKDIPSPRAQGGGGVRFEQWSGKSYRSKLIRRTARYRVNGERPRGDPE